MTVLTSIKLKELLQYEPNSGEFHWLIDRGGSAKAGRLAGRTDHRGYRIITVYKKLYRAHRLAWLFVHGQFPNDCIDHIDRDTQNNAIANLRVCSAAENQQNVKIRVDNTSGTTGVYYNNQNKNWRAKIRKNGIVYGLGSFKSFDEAVAARVAAKLAFHTFHPFQLPSVPADAPGQADAPTDSGRDQSPIA